MTGTAVDFRLVPASKLRRHEHVADDEVAKLAERLEHDGVLHKPVVADAGTFVILDGHHRFAALQRLGCRLIPCHLVDYQDPSIRVVRWDDGRPMDKGELVARALSGDLYPVKTSRHTTLRRIPPRSTRLEELGGAATDGSSGGAAA